MFNYSTTCRMTLSNSAFAMKGFLVKLLSGFRPARALLGFVLTIAALVGAVAFAPAAEAHSELESSTPAEGATVSTLTELKLTFGEAVVPEMSKYTLTDEMGMVAKLGEPTYDSTKTIVTIPLRSIIMGGKQVIGYAVLSIDGHPISGKINFTMAGGAMGAPGDKDHSGMPRPDGDHHDLDGDHNAGATSNVWANIGYAAGGLVGGALVVLIITLVARRRSTAKQARLDGDNSSE